MKVSDDQGLSHWGYRPLSAYNASKGLNFHGSVDAMKSVRKQSEADLVTIKAKGHKPYGDSFKTRIAAIGAASHIERETGVEMIVTNHGYI